MLINNINFKKNNIFDDILNNDNIKIDISKNIFDELNNIEKKIIFLYLIDNDNKNLIESDFLIDVNTNKDKYELNYYEAKYFQKKINHFLSNIDNLKKYFIDPYNITRFSKLKNLNNIFSHYTLSDNNEKKNYDFSYLRNHDKLTHLGIYILSKYNSPGFNNFRELIFHLKDIINITIFLDDNLDDMDQYDLGFLQNTNHYFIKNYSDEEFSNLILKSELTMLIHIYATFTRNSFIKYKCAPITIIYQEPPVIYPIYYYDYNLIDENIYKSIKKYIDHNIYNFILLKDIFVLPSPFYSDKQIINKWPIYDANKIRIGCICHCPKINFEFIEVINKILELNKNIYITLYGFFDGTWLNKIFNSNRINQDTYDNSNPEKLIDNILFLDTITYNNHSTAIEILRIKRPIISYTSKNYYHGKFSQSILKNSNLDKYCLSESIDDYVNKIKLILHSEESYYLFYKKFLKKLNTNNICNNKIYAEKFVNSLNNFYVNNKQKIYEKHHI